MKRTSPSQRFFWAVIPVFLLLAPMTTVANGDLDVTMRMVTDDVELTDSVVREIELPSAIQRPDSPGEPGSRGRDLVDKARENGREFGESMSERARESREVSGGRPERPQLPERPERPELPDAAGRER